MRSDSKRGKSSPSSSNGEPTPRGRASITRAANSWSLIARRMPFCTCAFSVHPEISTRGGHRHGLVHHAVDGEPDVGEPDPLRGCPVLHLARQYIEQFEQLRCVEPLRFQVLDDLLDLPASRPPTPAATGVSARSWSVGRAASRSPRGGTAPGQRKGWSQGDLPQLIAARAEQVRADPAHCVQTRLRAQGCWASPCIVDYGAFGG